MNTKWLILKVLVHKRCSFEWDGVTSRIGLVSHHLESLLGAIELINRFRVHSCAE